MNTQNQKQNQANQAGNQDRGGAPDPPTPDKDNRYYDSQSGDDAPLTNKWLWIGGGLVILMVAVVLIGQRGGLTPGEDGQGTEVSPTTETEGEGTTGTEGATEGEGEGTTGTEGATGTPTPGDATTPPATTPAAPAPTTTPTQPPGTTPGTTPPVAGTPTPEPAPATS